MNTKITGYPGTITVTEGTRGETVIGIDPTYGGQPSIVEVGTLGIGNWCASTILSRHGGTGVDNRGFTIAVDGNVYIANSITIECEEDTVVSLPKAGRLVNREEALDPTKNLKDCANPGNAYDNIAPVSAKGDIVVFDGAYSCPLAVGEEGQILSPNPEKPLGVEWKDSPSCYSVISNGDRSFKQRDTLAFIGTSFEVQDYPEECFTMIKGHPFLESLLETLEDATFAIDYIPPTSDVGVLHFNHYDDEEPFSIKAIRNNPGIEIEYNDASYNIGIDPNYKGQPSIDTLGDIKKGKWHANPVEPKFGGTGYANEHGVSLGGELATSCLVTIGDPDLKAQYIVLNAHGDTRLSLPQQGILATQEESLQNKHNLGDVENTAEAFRNISPTQFRGDLIVRGYGDYDIREPIGIHGQVLTVDVTRPGLIRWKSIDIEDQVEELVRKHVKKYLTHQEVEVKLVESKVGNIPIAEIVNVILMQFDMMTRTGGLQPIKELRQVLEHWKKHKVG